MARWARGPENDIAVALLEYETSIDPKPLLQAADGFMQCLLPVLARSLGDRNIPYSRLTAIALIYMGASCLRDHGWDEARCEALFKGVLVALARRAEDLENAASANPRMH